MQTLDLSGETRKTDGRLKSLFWPTVENAWDVDYLGQQGFWICLIIAVLSTVFLVVTASAVSNPGGRVAVLLLAGVTFFVYLVGGMGVRESSWPAAAIIFALYVFNQLGSGRAPGILSFIIGAVLLSNVRATFLASRWKPAEEGEDRPMRFNETLRDKLVDQVPPKAWPILKIPFYIVSSILFLFLAYASIILILRGPVRPAYTEDAAPSTTVTVAPPDTK